MDRIKITITHVCPSVEYKNAIRDRLLKIPNALRWSEAGASYWK